MATRCLGAAAPKGHVDVSPLGVGGGKPTRAHRIRVRTRRSERLQSPALGIAPTSQVAALIPREMRRKSNRPPLRQTIKSHLAYVNLTGAFFKQTSYRNRNGCCKEVTPWCQKRMAPVATARGRSKAGQGAKTRQARKPHPRLLATRRHLT